MPPLKLAQANLSAFSLAQVAQLSSGPTGAPHLMRGEPRMRWGGGACRTARAGGAGRAGLAPGAQGPNWALKPELGAEALFNYRLRLAVSEDGHEG